MASSSTTGPGRPGAWRLRAGLILMGLPLALAGACWWLTAPLEEPDTAGRPTASGSATGSAGDRPAPAPEPDSAATVAAPRPPGPPDWPEGRVEGDAAKRLLLDMMLAVQGRLREVAGYTATFRKQERLNGVLGPEQVMAMKIRHRPFAVYLKYLSPYEGKEVVYAEGQHENKIIAHSGGLARFLVPRLAVPPDHPLALAEARHPITEAGLANLTDKLVGFRRMDVDDPEAVTVLDRTIDARGRARLRSFHEHPRNDSRRPFARVEILYDPESRLPLQIRNYDWPRPGQQGDLLLAECYVYDDVDLNASLNALDFDPANPAYAFHRY